MQFPKPTSRIARLAIPAICIIGFAGCSSSSDTSSATNPTATSIETGAAPAPVETTTTLAAATTTAMTAPATTVITLAPVPAETTAVTNAAGVDPAGDKIMPDVVCQNLQAAQDIIQTHGVFLSLSEDATGAGRNQLVDRNWIVVAQRPIAGTPFTEGDAVLSVVKLTEPNPC